MSLDLFQIFQNFLISIRDVVRLRQRNGALREHIGSTPELVRLQVRLTRECLSAFAFVLLIGLALALGGLG